MSVDIIAAFAAFVFGVCIGSFLNVVILRSIAGKKLTGRSHCPSCGTTLSWKELIPIFSFIFLRGRCRTCAAHISVQYPVIELVTGLVGLACLPAGRLAVFAAICVLIVLFVIDLKTMMLPDVFVGILTFIAGLRYVIIQSYGVSTLGIGIAVAVLPLLAIWLATKGGGIGLGDVKLAVPLGMLAGPSGAAVLLFIAFAAGGIVGLFLLITGKATPKTAIPFGPFLCGSAILLLLLPNIVEVAVALIL